MSEVLDKIVDSISDAFVARQIHPSYLKIRVMLIEDGIKSLQCFADKYHDTENFMELYKKRVDNV